jgi:flagellar basal body-associated protein FliL
MTISHIIGSLSQFLASVEADAFAVMMLVVIFFSLGIVGLLLWMMKVKAAQRDPHVDALLDELEQSAKDSKANTEKKPQNEKPNLPWEKQADWWKSPPDQ